MCSFVCVRVSLLVYSILRLVRAMIVCLLTWSIVSVCVCLFVVVVACVFVSFVVCYFAWLCVVCVGGGIA